MTGISAATDYDASGARGLQTSVPPVDAQDIALGPSRVVDYLKAPSADQTTAPLLVQGVQGQVERRIGRLLSQREVTAEWSSVPEVARLPFPPQGTIDTVTKIDAVGGETVLVKGDGYDVRGTDQKRLHVEAKDGLRVTYQAGYETVPPALKMQMLRDIASRYDRRGTTVKEGVSKLPDPSAYDQWRVLQ